MKYDAIDLFAGPGGWSEGICGIGLRDLGIEIDHAACSTRHAAGHATMRADVAAMNPAPYAGFAPGLIASPPCQAYTMAGAGLGRAEIHKVHDAISACRNGWNDLVLAREWDDPRSPLILQPLRWAWFTRPEWITLEQVPPALDAWKHMADVLRGWGYAADARVLCAADYGVPQTRDRAYLLASRTGPVRWPEPTHAERPEPSLFGPQRLPWVTMAQALGWGMTHRPYPVIASGRDTGGPDKEKVGGSAARAAIYAELAAGRWVLNPGQTATQPNRRTYSANEPAPTIAFGHDANNWCWERPATTDCGDQSVRLIESEAAVLQGFPADYPWQGNKSERFRQIGDAVCPPMAAALVGAITAAAEADNREEMSA